MNRSLRIGLFLLLFLVIIVIVLITRNNNDTNPDDPIVPSIPAPVILTTTIDSIYPHDTSAYTQGLEFYKGKLYEATGDYENSSVRIVDVRTGKTEKIHRMGTKEIFGEGITILNDTLYQLTWQNKQVFVYHIKDITKAIKTIPWPHEGWGITNDGKNLIISDGTSTIYFVSPSDFKIVKQIIVGDNNGSIANLNELEYVKGSIYANVYQTDFIIKIDPETGNVIGKISSPNLIETYDAKEVTNRTDVLNGIAYDSSSNKFYITGKRWPKMFRFKLN